MTDINALQDRYDELQAVADQALAELTAARGAAPLEVGDKIEVPDKVNAIVASSKVWGEYPPFTVEHIYGGRALITDANDNTIGVWFVNDLRRCGS